MNTQSRNIVLCLLQLLFIINKMVSFYLQLGIEDLLNRLSDLDACTVSHQVKYFCIKVGQFIDSGAHNVSHQPLVAQLLVLQKVPLRLWISEFLNCFLRKLHECIFSLLNYNSTLLYGISLRDKLIFLSKKDHIVLRGNLFGLCSSVLL